MTQEISPSRPYGHDEQRHDKHFFRVHQSLPAVQKASTEEIVELFHLFNLLHGRFNVVRDPHKLDEGIGDHDKTALRVPVARLADGADVYDRLLFADLEAMFKLVGAIKIRSF